MRKVQLLLSLLIVIQASLAGAPAPARLVSLTPSITSQLYELQVHNRVVGITTFCRRVDERQAVVGTYLQPNIERIVSLKPDMVLISKEGAAPEIASLLEKFRIRLRVFEPVNSLDDLISHARELAVLVDARETCAVLEREAAAAGLRADSLIRAPRVLALIALDPMVAASSRSYVGAVIARAGGQVVLRTEVRYPVLSPEEVVRLDPDVILIADMGASEEAYERFKRRFRRVRAVRRNAVYRMDPDVLCQPTLGKWRQGVIAVGEVLRR